MKIAFFGEDGKVVKTHDFILESQKETTLEIDNQNFAAVLPNHEDWCFIKIIFDDESL